MRKKLDELKKIFSNEMDEWLEDNEFLVMNVEEKEQLLKIVPFSLFRHRTRTN